MEFTYPVIPKNIIRSNVKEKDVKRCNSPHQSSRKTFSRNSVLRSRNVACFSERLGPLRQSFQEMSDKLHQFSTECNLDIMAPSLMNQFKILDKEYEKFCSQVNVILSSIHPSTSLKNTLVTSTNIKQANLLIGEWVELIKIFNTITSDGLMPHFQIISREFDSLKKTVKNIVQLFSNSNLMPTINPSLVRKIYAKIDEYKKYYFELYRKVEFQKPFLYDAANILPNIQKLIDSIGNIFLYELPNITMSTSEVMMKKNQMTYHCEYVLNLVNGTAKFTLLGNESIESFKKVNEQLKSLFDFLKIPFSLELSFCDIDNLNIEEEEEVIEENKEPLPKDEITLKNQESVDAMRKRIQAMQKTILDAHSKNENSES